MTDLTQERLKQLLHYNPDTGAFTWLVSTSSRSMSGSIAGTIAHGYRYISIGGREGKKYAAHRLVWMYLYGRWPAAQIDHINRCKDDNRISNLRDATSSQNGANKIRSSGTAKGVCWDKRMNMWRAYIKKNKRMYHLGHHAKHQDAAQAYANKAAELFGEFARVDSD